MLRSLVSRGWLWLVLPLATLLRWPLLTGSFWLDEAAQALESTRPWWQQLQIAADFQPPLYHLLVHGLQYVSHAEAWLRLASVVPGVLIVGLVWHIARRYTDLSTANGASLLVASNALLIFFSQELRPYMLAVAWGLASWYAWLRWRDEGNAQRNDQGSNQGAPTTTADRSPWGLWLMITLLGGLFTSYVFVFWWLSLWLVTMIWQRSRWGALTRLQAVAGLWWATWWPWFWEQWQIGHDLRLSVPGWEAVVSTPFIKAVPLLLAKFLVGPLTVDFTLPYVVGIGGWYGLLGLAWVGRWWRSQRQRWPLSLFWQQTIGLVICTITSTWIFSLLTPVMAPKRVLFVLPLLLIIAAGVWRQAGRVLGTAVLGIYLIWQSGALLTYWTNPQLQREDWRTLQWEIAASFSPLNTAVIFGFAGPFAPWEWYGEVSYRTFATGTRPLPDLETTAQALAGVTQYERVLVFDYLRDLTDPQRYIEAYLLVQGYRDCGVIEAPSIGFVRCFERDTLLARKR